METGDFTGGAREAVVRIPSGSDPTVTYTVRLVENGPAICECKGYQYRKTCRHIAEALVQVQTGKVIYAPPAGFADPDEVPVDAPLLAAPRDEVTAEEFGRILDSLE